jgi:hypothetical protein
MKERILKIATKPQSIRLSKVDVAHYLVKLQDSNEDLDSLSACIRYCVQKTMALEPIADVVTPEEQDPRTLPHIKEEEEVVEPEPVPEEPEEEEMEF